MFLDPTTIVFNRKWNIYIKSNCDDWTEEKFQKVYSFQNAAEIWNFLNNFPSNITSTYNIFIMQDNLLPLYEKYPDFFANGGIWSTIVKGVPWSKPLNEHTDQL